MPPNTSKLGSAKVLHSQTREVIYNVYKFMTEEALRAAPNNRPKVQHKVCEATGISERSLRRIIQQAKAIEGGESTSFLTPGKKRNKPKKYNLDDFDKEVVRRTIYNFHLTNNELPTLKKIHAKLTKDINFEGSISSLRGIVKQLGFRWKKTEDCRKILIEKHDIRLKRVQFITKIRQYRAEGRPIVYTDETYIHSSHTKPSSWSDGTQHGVKAPVSKGKRLIVVHAGSKNGFIPNASLIYESDKKSGDYHADMNFQNYSTWLFNKLIPNLPANSVLVMDNASYHNTLHDRAPTSSSRKSDMIEWLKKKKIQFNEKMLKPELYNLIKANKVNHIFFQIDRMLANYGHSVIRLPPYHPDLNPIEKIWALAKDYVAQKNTTFKLCDAKKLLEEKFASITDKEWSARCDHAIKAENKYMDNEPLIDEISDHIIINLEDDSDSETSSESDNSDSEEDILTDLEGIEALDQTTHC